jgi:hypothetical protein
MGIQFCGAETIADGRKLNSKMIKAQLIAAFGFIALRKLIVSQFN